MPETETINAAADLKPTRLRGQIDVIRHNMISGWAYNSAHGALTLVVKANGRPIGQVTADLFREDLLKAGIGDGFCGFIFRPSVGLDRDLSYEISVSGELDGAELAGSPVLLLPAEAPYTRPIVRTKADVCNQLIRKYNFNSYLEISASSTGFHFDEIESSCLQRRDRIVYACPVDFDDGSPVTWRSKDRNLDEVAANVFRQGRTYDVVFIDSLHTSACSARDLAFALSVLSPGGVIAMHDASPPRSDLTSPEFIPGSWCGQSYAALIDFLLMHSRIGAYVVDVDMGVAILGSPTAEPITVDEALRATWQALPDDPNARFAFFDSHRAKLLNLISVEDFLLRERLMPKEVPSRQFLKIFPVGRDYRQLGRTELLRDLARVHTHLGYSAEARRLLQIALLKNQDTVFAQDLLNSLPD